LLGNGTNPVVWTYSVTGTDATMTVTAGAFTLNTSLALGANDLTMTGSLGATGARLTKIWAAAAEFTAYPTVNGAAVFDQDVSADANPSFGTLNLVSTNALNLGTGSSKAGEARFKNATNNNYFYLLGGVSGANIGWTFPTAVPAGENYLLRSSTTGVLSYVDPATVGAGGVPTTITVANEASDATSFPLFATATTGDLGPKTNAGLTFDATTATLGATKFAGALNGTVGATTPAAGKFTTLEASTSLAVTAATTTGGYIRLLEGTNNGTDYSMITGAADAGTYPSFTFSGSQGSEDLVLTATSDMWTFSSTTAAALTITPALTVTGLLTSSGGASVTKVNAAGGSASQIALSGTLGAMDGSGDYFRGVYGNWTNANHSAGNVYGVDLQLNAGDAEATERAVNVSANWDHGLYSLSPLYVGDGTNGVTITAGGVTTAAGTGSIEATTVKASTSNALGIGSIELGHASDTTIARVSAGVVSIENNNIDTYQTTIDGSAHVHLTAIQMQRPTCHVSNYGQTTADVSIGLPTAAANLSCLFSVDTAQANHWGVLADTNDGITIIAADGTISAQGTDGAAAIMTAAQVGQTFACWSARTGASAWDWRCKAVAIGTSTFVAHAAY
jgi:hypothetical protein